MKIIEITNVDFSLRHFLLPLMRAIRARGHEVIGVCAEGPLLDGVARRGLPRSSRLPLRPPRLAAGALAGVPRPGAAVSRGAAGPGACAHADQRLPRAAGGAVAGVPTRRLHLPRLPVQPPGLLAAPRAVGFAMEWLGRTGHRHVPDRSSRRRRTMRGACASPRRRGGRQRPRPRACSDPTRRRARASVRSLACRRTRWWCIAVSRLVWHKGYPELAAAMRAVPRRELWVVGRAAGPPTAVPTWPRCCATPASATRLRLLGYRDDVPALLAAADIFVLPSHFEGLPMSVIEAMLTGLPVVATNVRGPAEQVVPEATGLLVPAGDQSALAAALAGWCAICAACADGRGRPRAGAGTLRRGARCSRERWTCWGCRSNPARSHNGPPP